MSSDVSSLTSLGIYVPGKPLSFPLSLRGRGFWSSRRGAVVNESD